MAVSAVEAVVDLDIFGLAGQLIGGHSFLRRTTHLPGTSTTWFAVF